MGRHRLFSRSDPVQDHTPPESTISSFSDTSSPIIDNTYTKQYIDPATGKMVEETVTETRDPNNKHRRIRKHKLRRRSVSRGASEGPVEKEVVETEETYMPPPQAVYPGDSISSAGDRRSRRDVYESDSDYSDSSRPRHKRGNSLSRAFAKISLAGAAAEIKHKHDERKRRRSMSRGRRSDYDDTTDASSRASSWSKSRSRSRRKDKHDKHLEEAAIIGAGAAVAEHEHRKHKKERRRHSLSRSRSRSRHGYSDSEYDSDHSRHSRHSRRGSRSRYMSEEELTRKQREQAAKAALVTAAVQAFRSRKLPGGMAGEQGIRRIVEAAVASGALEMMLDKRKVTDEKRKHMLESIIGGLVSQRVLEGSQKEARSVSRGAHPGRAKRESHGGSSMAKLVGTGAALYAGKKLYDEHSRSRSRHRSFSGERDRRGRPKPNRQRSHSFPALLGAVGLGGAAEEYHRRNRSRSRSSDGSRRSRQSRRTVGLYEGGRGFDNDRDPGDGYRGDNYAMPVAVAAPAGYAAAPGAPVQGQEVARGDGGERVKEMSELSDDDPNLPKGELAKRRKKKKQREIVTAALAVLGVVGAAQKLYEGREAHKLRREMVIEGEMSKQAANRKRRKAKMKEGAALGLAALAMWEMYDDGKKAYQNHKDRVCFEENCRKRHNRVGEHVDAVDKKDGKPDGTRKQRKRQQLMAGGEGENANYYDPNVAYAQYPDAAMGGGRGPGQVPVVPAYPAGVVPLQPVAPAPTPAYATRPDGRQVPVVYPDHVSQVA